MTWFSLYDKEGQLIKYKKAWKICPDYVLKEFKKLIGAENIELLKYFKSVTGRDLNKLS